MKTPVVSGIGTVRVLIMTPELRLAPTIVCNVTTLEGALRALKLVLPFETALAL